MSRSVTWVSAAVALLVGLGIPSATSTPASATNRAPVSLISQSVNTVLGPTSSAHFSISLAGAPSDTVTFALYRALSTRSAVLSAKAGQGLGTPLGHSDSVALRCGITTTSSNTFTISLTATGSSRPGGCAPTVATISLSCSYAGQTCGGVYPLKVTTPTRSFVTFITVVGSRVIQPLRVASLFTLQPGHGATKALSDLSGALGAEASVPVDLLASPAAIEALARNPQASTPLRALKLWASSSRSHELLNAPLVPIDPAVLRVSKLGATSAQVLDRGTAISEANGFTTSTRSAGWVAGNSPSPQTLSDVGKLGFSRVLVNDNDLSQPTATGLFWGQPFKVSGAPSSTMVIAIDPVISAEMNAGRDPQLHAYQLLADLAFHHFERPSLSTPQGIVVMAPSSWVPSAAFMETYLNGLNHNDVLEATTLSRLFRSVPLGGNGAAGIRQLRSAASSAWPARQVNRFRSEQHLQADFATATLAAPPRALALADLLLGATNVGLSLTQRSAVLSHATAALRAQRDQLNVSTAQITTTALRESIPITITSTANYPIAGILTIASDQLRFPSGQRFHFMISRSTKVIRIPTRAPTTGSFTASVTLTTPRGGLILAKAKLLVVASRTSIVAIILTIGALAVLLVWWVRTWLTGAKKKRRRH